MKRGRYLTVAQAAERFPLTEKAIRRLIEKRRLPIHRLGARVYLAEVDLEELFVAGRVEPPKRRRLRAASSSPERVAAPGHHSGAATPADPTMRGEPCRSYPTGLVATPGAGATTQGASRAGRMTPPIPGASR
jgi:excisionase family DNA binding protein